VRVRRVHAPRLDDAGAEEAETGRAHGGGSENPAAENKKVGAGGERGAGHAGGMPVTDLQRYLFDLNGFIRLPGALSPAELADANARIDALPAMPPGGWHGHVHREVFEPSRGIAYQQVYEMGGTFERMIDHPSWIEHVRHFIGGQDTFDAWYGGEFIDECFVSLRGPGEAIGLHSGNGHSKRITYRVHNGRFACMQVNVLVALDRIGPGDGATMVIPGSHKANFPHPEFDTYRIAPDQANSCDGAPGAVEVHLEPRPPHQCRPASHRRLPLQPGVHLLPLRLPPVR
jgi:hypothetical protein